MVIASSEGGVNIEEVAAETPEAIFYEPIDIKKGITQEQAKKVAQKIVLDNQVAKIADMLMKLYKLFITKDALLIEINPYAEDPEGNCTTLTFWQIFSLFSNSVIFNSLFFGRKVSF